MSLTSFVCRSSNVTISLIKKYIFLCKSLFDCNGLKLPHLSSVTHKLAKDDIFEARDDFSNTCAKIVLLIYLQTYGKRLTVLISKYFILFIVLFESIWIGL